MIIIKESMKKHNITNVHLRINRTGILVTDLDDGRQFLYRDIQCVDMVGVDFYKNPDCKVPNATARIKVNYED